jgi:hypothetical protein
MIPAQFSIDNPGTGRYNTHRICVYAGVAQLVECKLPKLDVAGSSPVARSITHKTELIIPRRHEGMHEGLCL